MGLKLLTEHHFEFLSLIGGCTGSSESILVHMPHCWKSHVAARITQCDFCDFTCLERADILALVYMMLSCVLLLSYVCPGSVVVLNCIDS